MSSVATAVQTTRDDRKSAAIAAANSRPNPGSRVAKSFAFAREILRSPDVRQAGAGADLIPNENPEHVSFFFLDGELHRKRRSAVANYFTPKAITTRYHPVMHRTMDGLIAQLQRDGSAKLDELSFQMAVDVAADILGLTNSDSPMGLARRIKRLLSVGTTPAGGKLGALLHKAKMAWYATVFWNKDLVPAIEARKIEPKDDVISYMVRENYSKKNMIIECLTYGSAGMMTTREFIVMCAWHLFEKDDLRRRYLEGSEADQFAILEEILRLEPVAAMLHRKAATELPETAGGPVHEGEVIAIDIRLANTDEAITGENPYALDPDRAKRMKVVGSYLSFGDGAHRCPGSQVALHETRIFLDRLLRVPGIRMAHEPDIIWNPGIQGYELRNSVVACDRA